MSNLNPHSVSSRLRRKQKVPLKKGKVLKMISTMDRTSDRAAKDAEEFFTSGRTGRRNAMADILSIHAKTSTADMPAKLQALSTSANDGPLAGPSMNNENNDSLEQSSVANQAAGEQSIVHVDKTEHNSVEFNNT